VVPGATAELIVKNENTAAALIPGSGERSAVQRLSSPRTESMRESSCQPLAASAGVVAVAVVAVVLVSLASGSSVAADEASFDVSITVDDAVDAGEDLQVTATVRNRGAAAGTQDVTLTDGEGTVLDTANVSLDAGESTTVNLTWAGVAGDQRTVTPTVTSETDVDAAVVTVRWSAFSVTDLEPTEVTLGPGEGFDLSALVRNTGTAAGERDVVLSVGGSTYAVKENVTVEAESFATVRFGGIDPSLEPGTYSYTVQAGEGSASGTLTVQADARFTVGSIEGSYDGETATVEATVRNEGDVADTQPVTITVDGEFAEERLLSLDGGEKQELRFSTEPAAVPINVTVSTAAPDAASVRVGQANIEFGPRVDGVTPADVDLGDQVNVTYTAAGENLAEARLVVEAPDGSVAFETTVPAGTETTYAIPQAELSPYLAGSYDVTLRVEDEFGRVDSHTLGDAFAAAAEIESGPILGPVEPGFLQLDDTLLINYTAAGRNIVGVDLLLRGPGGGVALERTVPQGVDRQHAINPAEIQGLEEGPYNVTLRIRDVFGGRETTTVEEAFEAAPVYTPDDGSFVETSYSTVAGDFVEVEVSLDGVDEAFVLVGDGSPGASHRFGGLFDILHVSGSSSFVINTRLLGTDRPSEAVYITGSGSVTSYAHDLGAGSPPSGAFSDLRFETRDYERIATNLSQMRRVVSVGQQRRPVQPGTLSLALGGGDSIVFRDDGVPDPRFPLDRATLELSEPTVGNVTTYRLPTGTADRVSFDLEGESEELAPDDLGTLLDAAVETDRLALGDRLLVEFEATGLYGSLLDTVEQPSAAVGETEPRLLTPAELRRFLDRPEGVSLSVAHTNPGPNVERTGIDLLNASTEDVSVILDPYFGGEDAMGRFYLLVDTRPPEPFESQPGDNETYQLQFAYEGADGERYTYPPTEPGQPPDPFDPRLGSGGEQFPYVGANDTGAVRTAEFTVEKRAVSYDRTTTDGRPIVTTDPGATISGTTNLAPGSDLPVRLVIDVQEEPLTVEIEDVMIEPDGSFSVSQDLSMLDRDDEVRIQFWAYQELLDERDLALFEERESVSTFEIAELQTQTLVREDVGPVVNVTGIVENTGEMTGNATVELLLDGEVIANKTRRIPRGDRAAFNFPAATDDIPPGQYTLELRTADDLAGELLVVEAAESLFEIDAFSVPGSVADGGNATVSTTVVNTGTIRNSGPVELLIDGDVVAERNLSLLVDEEATAVFEDALAGLEPGEYVLTVRTADEERSRPLVIEADDGEDGGDTGEDGNEGGSGSDSGDGAPSGGGGVALGVGAGSRALVGGTAVVGTVYVLGYYV